MYDRTLPTPHGHREENFPFFIPTLFFYPFCLDTHSLVWWHDILGELRCFFLIGCLNQTSPFWVTPMSLSNPTRDIDSSIIVYILTGVGIQISAVLRSTGIAIFFRASSFSLLFFLISSFFFISFYQTTKYIPTLHHARGLPILQTSRDSLDIFFFLSSHFFCALYLCVSHICIYVNIEDPEVRVLREIRKSCGFEILPSRYVRPYTLHRFHGTSDLYLVFAIRASIHTKDSPENLSPCILILILLSY